MGGTSGREGFHCFWLKSCAGFLDEIEKELG